MKEYKLIEAINNPEMQIHQGEKDWSRIRI
jgi:hypothetical protein